ncbi:fungal specific transcription factor domain-containing protein [Colletotrichum gloeosporioides Cg-14]|uniref:Fungal specific transcription factor domain-containing protein n=1 Tax=Colletotrichum gloeosporioides (strain Cg-14) TaxID=1237896 RepID=T0KWP5_COLGC|nr:fungal specific transcription factor domain-containing protein [Colletotrichum gloeosporioides Cg-14]
MAPEVSGVALPLDDIAKVPIEHTRIIIDDDPEHEHETDNPALTLVSLGRQIKLEAPPFMVRPKAYTKKLDFTVLGSSNSYSVTRALRHCCRAPQRTPNPNGQWWNYDFKILNISFQSKNHRLVYERECVPANHKFETLKYIAVGIRGPNVMPKEKLLPIHTGDDQGMFKQIYKASHSLRPWPRRLLSLKSISGFGIYRCFPKVGYHAPVQLHPETQGTLALLFADYQADYIEPGGQRWIQWMHREFNAGSTDPEEGIYALELILSWSAPKFIFWGMSPILLSLAIGICTLERASEQLQAQSRILNELFPDIPVEDLVGKTRSQLLALIPRDSLYNLPPTTQDPSPTDISAVDEDDDDNDPNDSTQISENGEPANDRRWDESAAAHQPTATIRASDDINAISLATDQHRRSYLGVTSMSAVLRAIFRLCPAAKEHTAQRAKSWTESSSLPHYQQSLPPLSILNAASQGMNPLREQRCIEFYFEHIHPITPILNEDDFRTTYAAGNRHDDSWLALLNMAFTLGSVASGSDTLHVQYYKQARAHLGLDSLGSGNMESLQALCLLGGYYLHYRNSPNMAYAVLGAAHRVAIALGLHREPVRSHRHAAEHTAEHHSIRTETRRRTWWSLFCLDTWASMTLGRPTCGRWDSSTMDTLLPTPLTPDDHVAASLRASCNFCHICDRIQHRFAQPARLSAHEALSFDRELRDWHASLPEALKNPANSPPRLTVAREFMRNRYLNVRLILSRCFLLYLAHDHSLKRGSTSATSDIASNISQEELSLVESCRTVASEAIDAITLYWTPNRVHVWNSAWYLFQACMVPLLSIAIETHRATAARKHQHQNAQRRTSGASTSVPITSITTPNHPPPAVAGSPDTVASVALQTWCASLTKALELFAEMRPWMRASDRAPDIVAALYEAVTAEVEGGSNAGSTIRTPSATTDGGMDLFGWCDEQLTELDWSTFLGGGSGGGLSAGDDHLMF